MNRRLVKKPAGGESDDFSFPKAPAGPGRSETPQRAARAAREPSPAVFVVPWRLVASTGSTRSLIRASSGPHRARLAVASVNRPVDVTSVTAQIRGVGRSRAARTAPPGAS